MKLLILAEEYGLYQSVTVILAAGALTLQAAGQPGWYVALILAAAVAVLDTALGFRRIRRDRRVEDQAAEMLVNGVYRIAPGHRVAQDGDRVLVYEATAG